MPALSSILSPDTFIVKVNFKSSCLDLLVPTGIKRFIAHTSFQVICCKCLYIGLDGGSLGWIWWEFEG